MLFKFGILLTLTSNYVSAGCENHCVPSLTVTSGKLARDVQLCSGDLIFEDNFDNLNLETWQHETTLGGGGNNEFQWYTNNRTNSYVKDGVLYITPTLTADHLGEDFLASGTLKLDGESPAFEECNNPLFNGCEQIGNATNIIQPIKSARLRTIESFNFRFGKVEVRAKLPAGDWLWPAIWFLPKSNLYGIWPASGEIDLTECRGNRNLIKNGKNIGVEQVSSNLHYRPKFPFNRYNTFSISSSEGVGFDRNFHNYKMEWAPEYIKFKVDEIDMGTVTVAGFWKRGQFENNNPKLENVWENGTLMAPFDEEFHILINLAVGGTSFFPDDTENPGGKPWANDSPQAKLDFWNGRNQWFPTWNHDDDDGTNESSLKIDYVKIWAL